MSRSHWNRGRGAKSQTARFGAGQVKLNPQKEKERGAIEGLPFLKYVEGEASNLNDFEEQMTIHLQREYHNYGLFMKLNEEYVPEPPDEPEDYVPGNRRISREWKLYERLEFETPQQQYSPQIMQAPNNRGPSTSISLASL
eukprot:gene12840-27071_t